ncbi:hypothetical protein NLI96_g771 [Meripilus lineatus]|uniref:Uncharacterized protein n=1 Tax=Meripilus lineatus TaxID=2056292 RepID=A0AAD5VC29_9APHY|nr:hypothetical protein NLI96_g771 [Physisporinus lineatus]
MHLTDSKDLNTHLQNPHEVVDSVRIEKKVVRNFQRYVLFRRSQSECTLKEGSAPVLACVMGSKYPFSMSKLLDSLGTELEARFGPSDHTNRMFSFLDSLWWVTSAYSEGGQDRISDRASGRG